MDKLADTAIRGGDPGFQGVYRLSCKEIRDD
jgi:hypothetical protein